MCKGLYNSVFCCVTQYRKVLTQKYNRIVLNLHYSICPSVNNRFVLYVKWFSYIFAQQSFNEQFSHCKSF